MKTGRTILAPAIVALAALATGGWLLQRGAAPETNIYSSARLFNEVLQHVSEAFVDERDDSDLYQMAIDGMLEELGDPHTGFMPAEEYESLRIQTQGEYGGLGISIANRSGWITVVTPLPGTPGERAGLRSGDQIVEVDGQTTRGWSEDEAVMRLRGPKGAPVDIKIARVGVEQPIPVHIVRDEIHIKAVPTAYMITPDVGYVELTVFSESSTAEVKQAVDMLRADGAKGVILDLRRNLGGLLDQGVSVSDLFLDRGQMVVETRGRLPEQNHRIPAFTADNYAGMPVVVLTSESSASAAEIVAGALQDHDRALLVGRTTFGKGSVQTVYELPGNNWLKLTTARWYTPSGRSIQRPYGIDSPRDVADGDVTDESDDVPTYKTDGGRTVYGGGGIRPDLVSHPDTLTHAERVLADALQANLGTYTETRFQFAVEFREANPDLQPNFEVTARMLDDFYGELVRADVELDRAIYDAAERWVEYQLGYEIAYSKWGVAEARKRENRMDPQVGVAVELLEEATDPSSLFAAANAYRTGQGQGLPGQEAAAGGR